MLNYKNTHIDHHRAVLEHFLKVGEARLYKLFEFARFGASTADHNEVLKQGPFEKCICIESCNVVIPAMKRR